MKNFDLQKKLCLEKLYKPDKSRKGDVDKPIIKLIDQINSLDDYYTTSSCSGRIYLLTEADEKPDVKWLYVSHEKVNVKNIINVLKEKLPNQRIWLRQENMILHVACRTIDDANIMLKIARDIGFRRSGIIADSNIIIVEICSTEKMDVPISDKGKLLVDENYIKFIVKIANEKFSKGRNKLNKFEEEVKKIS
ncbi:TPA: hypothetical protein HA363_04405 [Candidatus Woesearchaeota archaeon]|nr:hypothetical protein [uncultured archaeon]AQS34916.1 hypothetical protein [uncultured archaeon]HIJ01869.1 hypothetical protein [Candidatus Woesearchaeota archaeon]